MEIAQHSEWLGKIARIASYAGMLLAPGLVVAGWRRARRVAGDESAPGPELDAFRAGGAIYVGTFLLGNNWDYRLIFPLLTLPQLLRWASGEGWTRRVSRGLIVAMLLSLWHIAIHWTMSLAPGGSPADVLLDEVANWLVFLGLAWLLGRSLPASPDPAKADLARGQKLKGAPDSSGIVKVRRSRVPSKKWRPGKSDFVSWPPKFDR